AGKEAAEFLKKMMENEPKAFAVYSRDFKSGTPSPGWKFMWNEKGEIGKAANYSLLVWNAAHAFYATHPQDFPGGGGQWAHWNPGGCHPGPGMLQGQPVHRYAIAAYTLQTGQSGKALLSGKIQRPNVGHGGKVDLRVYIDDALKHSQ